MALEQLDRNQRLRFVLYLGKLSGWFFLSRDEEVIGVMQVPGILRGMCRAWNI